VNPRRVSVARSTVAMPRGVGRPAHRERGKHVEVGCRHRRRPHGDWVLRGRPGEAGSGRDPGGCPGRRQARRDSQGAQRPPTNTPRRAPQRTSCRTRPSRSPSSFPASARLTYPGGTFGLRPRSRRTSALPSCRLRGTVPGGFPGGFRSGTCEGPRPARHGQRSARCSFGQGLQGANLVTGPRLTHRPRLDALN
jgi:hypothetical protein